jgi:DNA ligase-1
LETQIIYATPELQALNSTGKPKYWRGFVGTNADEVFYYTLSWHEIESGALSRRIRSEPTVVQSKNIGRANETTPTEQAISEITAIMAKKIDSGYHEAGVASTVLPLPMLAHKFKDRSSALKYPCFVQPKIDGSRLLFDGVKSWSRTGKPYIPEVVAHLQFDTQGYTLDGEIVLPPEFTFQESMSAVKKFNENSPKLQYLVFDILDPDATFTERLDNLKELFEGEGIPENVHMVATYLCNDESEVSGYLTKALAKGYEGLILRNADALYAVGQRSVGLQKLKLFLDAEYLVIGVADGKGREDGAILYICDTPDKQAFTVRPEGSVESRKELFRQWEAGEWTPIGQKLTVRMQELSDGGVPRFPVGVSLRDYE